MLQHGEFDAGTVEVVDDHHLIEQREVVRMQVLFQVGLMDALQRPEDEGFVGIKDGDGAAILFHCADEGRSTVEARLPEQSTKLPLLLRVHARPTRRPGSLR